jgi:transposase-like protein
MRKHKEEYKRSIAKRVKAGEAVAAIAKSDKLANSLIYNWTKRFSDPSPKAVKKRKHTPMQEAIIYLHHARTAAVLSVTQDPSRMDDPVYLFAMMALRTLEGKLLE